MKIRKYEGENEKEAMLKVKEELGSDALIVSVKNIRPKGFYKLFKKPYVEVTAALDDQMVKGKVNLDSRSDLRDSKIQREEVQDDKIYLKRFKDVLNQMPDEQPSLNEKSINTFDEKDKESKATEKILANLEEGHEVVNSDILNAVYEQLIESEVSEEIVNQLTVGLEQMKSDDQEEVKDIIAVIYKRIVKLLSGNEVIDQEKKNNVFFIGPTGVGKTTTIAKIASYFTLVLGKKVALITSDTYRIAAVEQLRTYANILNIPIKVVYSSKELSEAVEQFKEKDLVLIDTAGRSHRHVEHQKELKELVDAIDESEVYLVLSLSTKYKDMKKIAQNYQWMNDYKVIFTKLDETTSFGNILNMKLLTGAKLSYVTFGQNVPDDISDLNPHEIARHLLGGPGDGSSIKS